MNCRHERIRCTDNRFFCLICGEELHQTDMAEEIPEEKQDAPEEAKKPVKRKAKKEAGA